MKEVEIVVKHKVGLHARPAALFVQTAAKYKSDVTITKLDSGSDREVNAKSILSILSLAVNKDSKVRIKANGEDEEEVVAALLELIESNFGEEE